MHDQMQATARPMVPIDAVSPATLSQSLTSGLVMDFILMLGFAWFVALSAQIAVRMTWTTVPITGQTLAVVVVQWRLPGWLRFRSIHRGLLRTEVLGQESVGHSGNADKQRHRVPSWPSVALLPYRLGLGSLQRFPAIG